MANLKYNKYILKCEELKSEKIVEVKDDWGLLLG